MISHVSVCDTELTVSVVMFASLKINCIWFESEMAFSCSREMYLLDHVQ
jgi:hypothetical protein